MSTQHTEGSDDIKRTLAKIQNEIVEMNTKITRVAENTSADAKKLQHEIALTKQEIQQQQHPY